MDYPFIYSILQSAMLRTPALTLRSGLITQRQLPPPQLNTPYGNEHLEQMQLSSNWRANLIEKSLLYAGYGTIMHLNTSYGYVPHKIKLVEWL